MSRRPHHPGRRFPSYEGAFITGRPGAGPSFPPDTYETDEEDFDIEYDSDIMDEEAMMGGPPRGAREYRDGAPAGARRVGVTGLGRGIDFGGGLLEGPGQRPRGHLIALLALGPHSEGPPPRNQGPWHRVVQALHPDFRCDEADHQHGGWCDEAYGDWMLEIAQGWEYHGPANPRMVVQFLRPYKQDVQDDIEEEYDRTPINLFGRGNRPMAGMGGMRGGGRRGGGRGGRMRAQGHHGIGTGF